MIFNPNPNWHCPHCQPAMPQPPHHNQNHRWPQGMTPQMPVLPHPPRPTGSHIPQGFPILSQARPGIVIAGRRTTPLHRWPMIFSQIIDYIPHNTLVWTFGERNGWTLIHFKGRFGFVNSRFMILL
ncbi:MAG: hypothetical protein FWE01_00695 [Firmicutes bacterium]|nr:hypothetical protein [Bacillota bacterium]